MNVENTAICNGNWLVTSAGAKVDLVRRMKAALNPVGLKLYAADCSALSAAFHFADGHVQLPLLSDDTFIPDLITFCREHSIGMVLPTRDADLLFFAQYRNVLEAEGIRPLVSALETIAVCGDKIRFHEHCCRHGLPVLPRIAAPADRDYPCFVRRRIGAAGVGAGRVQSADAMRAAYGGGAWPDVLIQPLCEAPEYSIDALFGLDGSAVQWVARERVRVRAGESVVSRTVKIPALDAVVMALAGSIQLFGPVTIQCFYSEATGVQLIEVNPRFGGASALGIEAGLATPERLVALAQGNYDLFLKERPLRYGLTMLRYSADVFV